VYEKLDVQGLISAVGGTGGAPGTGLNSGTTGSTGTTGVVLKYDSLMKAWV
jgi:hypothetical protein